MLKKLIKLVYAFWLYWVLVDVVKDKDKAKVIVRKIFK